MSPTMHYKLGDALSFEGPVVAREFIKPDGNISMRYHRFRSYKHLEKWYRQLDESERIYHEIIPEGKQKFKLDMETTDPKVTEKMWRLKVAKIIDIACDVIGSDEYLRYISIDPKKEKFSEHVIFTGCYLENSKSAALLLNDVLKRLKRCKSKAGDCCKIIDTGVYKRNQSFRMEGSTKTGVSRYKYLKGHKELSDKFLKGLVKNVNEDDSFLIEPQSKEIVREWFDNRLSKNFL